MAASADPPSPRHRRSPADALADIKEAIEQIQAHLADATPDGFAKDRWAQLATQKALENISEASRHLPPEMKDRHREIPWRQIADFGNIGRHGYFAVKPERLLQVVRDDLPPLAAAVDAMMAGLQKR